MTSPDSTNVVRVKTVLTNMNVQKSYRHIWPKKVKYPIPEIPDDSEKKIGYGLGIAKNYRVGSGIGYPSGPDHDMNRGRV